MQTLVSFSPSNAPLSPPNAGPRSPVHGCRVIFRQHMITTLRDKRDNVLTFCEGTIDSALSRDEQQQQPLQADPACPCPPSVVDQSAFSVLDKPSAQAHLCQDCLQ